MGQIISFIKNRLVGRFFKRRLIKQSEERSEDLEDQNGKYTLLDPSSDSDPDSSFRFHQNVGTTCNDIVEENNKEHDSVSCVLNVENLEERSEDLEGQNGQYALPVSNSTPEVLDPSSDSVSDIDADSRFRLHQNVGTTCINIVEENMQEQESVSCVLNVENLEERQIVGSVPERWIRHYCSTQRILVVGDGDFSFSASLARAFGSATNMVATSLDSRVMLHYKYTRAMAKLKELEELGCTIIHEVDCCTMSQHHDLKFILFDRIVYNFPHAGFFSEAATWVIERHKSVVWGFMRNATKMLAENGEVHITHKTAHPFNQWGIKNLAKKAGLRLIGEVPFSLSDYPGYRNKYGAGKRPDKSFPVGACSTYKFKKKST